MNEICRICFEKCSTSNQKIENYAEIILKVFQVKLTLDSNLPQFICEPCLNGVLEADLLRDMCLKSQAVCMKAFENEAICKLLDEDSDEAYITEACEDSESDGFSESILFGSFDKEKTARCCICGETFELLELMRAHCLTTHTIDLYDDPKVNQCMVCGIVYDDTNLLQTHLSVFNPVDQSKITEPVVPPQENPVPEPKNLPEVVFVEKKNSNPKRISKKKYKPGLAYQCHICKVYIRGYRSHMEREHPTEKLEFKCYVCARSYQFMNSLTSHMHNIHCGGKRFTCNICHKVFARNSLMIQHREVTHYNIKKFECSVCHMKFSRKQHMLNHEKTHSDSYFNCKLCRAIFDKENDLSDHIFKHIHGDI
uniref:CSON014662 protein n=1 Tax=Culicoides sonorensis TaxID=179676 RepID=A0A336MBF2_CULSO